MIASFSLLVAALAGSVAAGKYGNQTSLYSWSSSSTPTSSSLWPVSSSSTSSWGPVGTGSYSHHPSKSTETWATFTTTTICPITTTRTHASSWEIITTYSTSTMTVTSCKGGCNQHPTSAPPPPPPVTWPTQSPHETKTHVTVYPTTVVSTVTKFVPCSTPIATASGTTVYSTWLTPSYIPTSYVSTCTETWTSAAPTNTPTLPPVGGCPAPKTVTVTVTVGASKPTPPSGGGYETHTITLSNGQTTCVTIAPTSSHAGYSETSKPAYPTKPTGTGTGPSSMSSSAWGTGDLKWSKPTSVPKGWISSPLA